MKICGIYAWEHIPTGMLYIGSSIDCEKRKTQHTQKGSHFYRCANELGWENFTFRILEECLPEERRERERDWIVKLNSVHPHGFNIQKDPMKCWGYMWTDEMRAALSARTKVRSGTPEARAAMSEWSKKWHAANPEAKITNSARSRKWHTDNPGAASGRMKAYFSDPEARAAQSARKKMACSSPEVRAAMSERSKAYFSDPEARVAMSERMKKWHADNPEARAAHSERVKAYFSDPEARAAHSAIQKISHNTPEFKAAQSARLKITHNTPEFRAALSARQKAYFATHSSPACKSVSQYTMDGELVATFESGTRAAKELRFSKSSLSQAIKKGGTCGGFRWKFAETQISPKNEP